MKHKLAYLFSLFVMLLLLAALAPAALAEGYTVEVHAPDGTPLPAEVIFADSAGREFVTADYRGIARLDRDVEGTLLFAVVFPGLELWSNDYPDWKMAEDGHEVITLEEPKDTPHVPGYTVVVVDSMGDSVTRARVTYEDAISETTVESLSCSYEMDRRVIGPLHITVEHDGYVTWTNDSPDWKMANDHLEVITLHKVEELDLGLDFAFCYRNNHDLLETDVVKDVMRLSAAPSSAAVIDLTERGFTILARAKTPEKAVMYSLYQGGKLKATSESGNFEDLSTTDFEKGRDVYMKVEDAQGRYAITKLRLEFYSVRLNDNYMSWNLENFSIAAPDYIPFIGGSKIDISLPIKFPLTFAVGEDKIMVGFGLTDGNSDEARIDKINGAKKLVQELGSTTATAINNSGLTPEQQERFNDLATSGNDADILKPVKVRVIGYAELVPNPDPNGPLFTSVTGNLIIQISSQLFDGSWTTVCGIVPITLSLRITGGLDTLIHVTYDIQDEKFTAGNLTLTPYLSLNVFGGVGIGKVAAVGAYGDASMKFQLDSVPKFHCQSIDLSGEMGLKAYVWIFSYTKTFAKDTWNVYTNSEYSPNGTFDGVSYFNALLGMNDFSQYEVESLDYLKNEGEWISDRDDDYSSNADAASAFTKLLTDTYRNAQPVMVSTDGKLYAAFIRADEETDRRYTVVSKYENGSWSPLKETETEAMMDGTPSLAVSGDSIYLSYLRMPADMDHQTLATLDRETQMLSYAQGQQLVIGRLNPDTLEFTEEKVIECEGFLHSYTLSASDDSVTVAWFESEVGDANSVLTHTESELYTATLTGDGWSDTKAVATVSGNVGKIVLGERDGETLVAYTVNHPVTGSIEDSASLYVIGNAGTPECITDDCSGKVSFAKLPGTEQSDFVWNDEGRLVNAAGDAITVANVNSSYVIHGDAIYYSASKNSSGNLTCMQLIDGTWTSAMEMITDDSYLEDLSVVTVDGQTYVLGMNTTVTIGAENALDDAKDIVFAQLSSVSDLALADILCDRDNLVAGQNTTVELYVTNEGDHTVNSVEIWMNGDYLETRQITIPHNTTNSIPVTIKCPTEETIYTFEVRVPDERQHCAGRNIMAITLGYADFQVELTSQGLGAGEKLVVSVSNKGISTAVGKLEVFADDGKEKTVIYEMDLELYSGEFFSHSEFIDSIPHSSSTVVVTAVITPEVSDHNFLNDRDVFILFFDNAEYISYENMMVLPNSTITVADEAFANCAFEAVETDDELESIGSRAFANSTALKQVRLGNRVSFIADNAFEGCTEVILWCPYGSYAAEYAHLHAINYKLY